MKIRDTNSGPSNGSYMYSMPCKFMQLCMSLCYFLYAGAEQTELFYSMTEFAKEACKAAHNTLLVHCDQVAAGDVTLCDMRILKQNETTVDQLCTATCIRGFSLRKWLGRLEDIERYIEIVQQFHDFLHPDVQGMWRPFVHAVENV